MATCDYIKEMKKRQHKNPRKGVPLLAPFPSSGHSRPLVYFMTFGHDVYESAYIHILQILKVQNKIVVIILPQDESTLFMLHHDMNQLFSNSNDIFFKMVLCNKLI